MGRPNVTATPLMHVEIAYPLNTFLLRVVRVGLH